MEPVAASPADETRIRQLLSSCGSPHEDITPEHLHHFWVLKEKRQVIGVIGLEVLRPLALLRSLGKDGVKVMVRVKDPKVFEIIDRITLLPPSKKADDGNRKAHP